MTTLKPPTHKLQPSNQQVLFNPEAVHNLILAHGVEMEHWRAMVDPYGKTGRDDVRRPQMNDSYSTNGFIYTRAGTIKVLFSGNQHEVGHQDFGFVDGSTVQVTIPTIYSNSTNPAYMLVRDRLYLTDKTIVVPEWEQVEHQITGIDKTRFPVEYVQDLVDSSGNRYTQGSDFDIVDGKIQWGTRRPSWHTELNRGQVYTVRYLYRPYWYVRAIHHEIRLQPTLDSRGNTVLARFPQAIIIQREHVFENMTNTEESTGNTDARQIMLPEDGSFGPR